MKTKKNIASEITINNKLLKTKLGTINKKTLDTVYIDMGAFIIPLFDCEDFCEIIDDLEKLLKYIIKQNINNSNIFKKRYFFCFDTASSRMKKDKKSYIHLTCHLMPTSPSDLFALEKPVTEMVNNISDCIEGFLNEENFSYIENPRNVI